MPWELIMPKNTAKQGNTGKTKVSATKPTKPGKSGTRVKITRTKK